jgi:hypothetical protein
VPSTLPAQSFRRTLHDRFRSCVVVADFRASRVADEAPSQDSIPLIDFDYLMGTSVLLFQIDCPHKDNARIEATDFVGAPRNLNGYQ